MIVPIAPLVKAVRFDAELLDLLAELDMPASDIRPVVERMRHTLSGIDAVLAQGDLPE